MENSVHHSTGTKIQTVFSHDIPDGLGALLNNTVLGREGKLQYRHKNPLDKLSKINNRHILTIRGRGSVLASVVFVERTFYFNGKPIKAFYVRYLAFSKIFKVKNRVRQPDDHSDKGERAIRGMVKSAIKNYFDNLLAGTNQKALFYAFIEGENYNSLGLSDVFQYRVMRKVKPVLFSRIKPRQNNGVSQMAEEEKEFMENQLQKTYQKHTFFTIEGLFDDQKYYVFKENGEIVAGLHAEKITWEIVKLPGLAGLVAQKILPYIPFLPSVIENGEMSFMSFEGLWFAHGHASTLTRLMESLCAQHNVNLGMFYVDEECPVGKNIFISGQLGYLSRIIGGISANLVYHNISLSVDEEKSYTQNPAYVPSTDMT